MTRTVTTLPVTEKTVANGNWDTSRTPIDRIVIHTMVGTASAADARFNNPTQLVSAHYGVLLNGQLWHWVDEDNTAYHAGNYAMNQRSIGIEHEDNGDYNGVRSDALYKTSSVLVRDICKFYGIPIDRTHIIKHSEVIATGCPDALDIDRIVKGAQDAIPTPPTPIGPGYPPTFAGQDVTSNGVHYHSNDGKVWVIVPAINFEQKYNDEVVKNTDLQKQLDSANLKISKAKTDLNG